MASHHHPQHCHNSHLNSCCCCCSSNSSHPSQVSQSPTTDPLLQALAAQLLQSSQTHLYAQNLKPQQQQQLHQKHLYQKQQHQQQTQSLLYSLIRRVDALESSLHQISASPPPPTPSNSLRDLAARTIQTHFRAFLVRRSRTLRQLKDLAFIKASLNSLKSSMSDGSQLKPEMLSQKAMDLLLKLDSIQGGDPMIRDGKKSVSRDLARFLEFVDGLSTKKREISSKATKSLRLAENGNKSRVCISNRDPGIGAYQNAFQREFLEKLSSRSQGISDNNEERHVTLEAFHQISDDEDDPKRRPDYGGILMRRRALGSKAKKTVSFAENGNLTRVFEGTHESFSGGLGTGVDERFSDDDQRELVESREVEEIVPEDSDEEEAYMERKEFHQLTYGDINPRILQREVNYGKRVQRQSQNGEIAFSAPLPVQMEPIIREVRNGTVGGGGHESGSNDQYPPGIGEVTTI